MYSNKVAIEANELFKYYPVFEKPIERLKQILVGNTLKSSFEGDFSALNNISFKVNKGEVVAILGSNGSGKSTLLQIICGTLTPSLGNVSVNGRIAALLELGAGFNLDFTGRENIVLNASILGLSELEIDERIDDIIAFSELGDHIELPVKSYSSGMFVRLAFSVAVNVFPDILIVDEALSVGDAKFQAKCINKIQEIIASGTTLLFVSHDVTAVRTICDRAIWLDKGNLIMDGDVFEVSGKYMEFMLDEQQRDIVSFVHDEVESIDTFIEEKSHSDDKPTYKDQMELSNNAASHWGLLKGCIKRVRLFDCNKKNKNVFERDEEIVISVDIQFPEACPTEHVDVAFSIKNTKGVDLIVGSYGVNKKFLENDFFNVSFTLRNELAPSNYIVVIAIEDNKKNEPTYYEYIEGACYFSTNCRNKVHGIFLPQIKIKTEVTNED